MSAARQLADAALAVARRRNDVLRRARAALIRGDEHEALRCLRILVGLEEDDAKRDRAHARQH